MIRPQFFAVAVLTAVAALVTPTSSQAGFKITLSQTGYSDLVITDGGSGDFSGLNGVISSAQSYGSFSFVANLASSNSAGGTAPAILTINNLTINWSGVGPRTLTISVEDTGFTAPGVGPASVTSNLSGWSIPGGEATYQSFLNNNPGTLLTGNGTATDSLSIGTTPYALRSVLTITMGGYGVAQGMGSTTVNGENAVVAPAPSGLILAATALPFLGLLRRRLRRTETAASLPA